MEELSATAFLNVDLDLRGATRMDGLLGAWGNAVVVLNHGGHSVSLELASQPQSAEEAIAEWLALVERLPSAPRAIWHDCESRVFNIGIQAGLQPHAFLCGLSRELLQRLAAVGGEVAVTVYAATPMG